MGETSESYGEIVQEPETESEEEEEVLDPDAPLIESVGEVKVVAKRKKKEKPLQKPDNVEELLEEKEEDISDHGILYRTLKSAMNHVHYGRKKTSVETGQHALPGAGGDGELRQ